jgi:hypothetical protein
MVGTWTKSIGVGRKSRSLRGRNIYLQIRSTNATIIPPGPVSHAFHSGRCRRSGGLPCRPVDVSWMIIDFEELTARPSSFAIAADDPRSGLAG